MRAVIGAFLAPATLAVAQFAVGLTGYAKDNPAHLEKLIEAVLFMTVPWIYGFSAVVGVPLFFLFRRRRRLRGLFFCCGLAVVAAGAGFLLALANPGPHGDTIPRHVVVVSVLFAGLAAVEGVVFCLIAGWIGPRRWVAQVEAG